jgi:hypothetical protein
MVGNDDASGRITMALHIVLDRFLVAMIVPDDRVQMSRVNWHSLVDFLR